MALERHSVYAATLLLGEGFVSVLVRQTAWAGPPATIATRQDGAYFCARNGERNRLGAFVLAAGLLLFATAVTCLMAERPLAQQSPEAEITLPTDPVPSTLDAEGSGMTQTLSESESPSDVWPEEEADPLQGLFDDTVGQTPRPSASTRPKANKDAFDEMKSLLKQLDPRESLDFQLPEGLMGGAVTDSRPRADDNSPSRDAAQAEGSTDGYSSAGRVTPPPPQTQTSIGELQSIVVEVFSDFRIYAYLLLSLGAVVGVFVLGVVIKRSRDRHERRLKRRRGRGRRRSRRGLAHS